MREQGERNEGDREGWRDGGRGLLVQTLGKLTSSLLSASHQVTPHTSPINKPQADSATQVVTHNNINTLLE